MMPIVSPQRGFAQRTTKEASVHTLVCALIVVIMTLPALVRAQTSELAHRALEAHAVEEWPVNTFAVLCYHDIRDDLLARPDTYTVESGQLAQQFAWLKGNRYHVVSLSDVIASRSGGPVLPPRAVLLSFDDGLESLYERAYPLLLAYHYPAISALVGTWKDEAGPGGEIRYGDADLPPTDFLSASQIATMKASGLVEFASHTYALHHGILANPQGNLEPAVIARVYDPERKTYEDEETHRRRVRADLEKNSVAIEQLTGERPRMIVWPYGAYDAEAAASATSLGMPYALTLEDGLNTPDVPLAHLRRILITHDNTPKDIAAALVLHRVPEPVRVMQVDLDYVFDADPRQQEANLSALLDRVKAMGVNTVYLQAFADPSGTGTASALYFPNRHLPMRADLFNRVAWQLRTRTGVNVFAWMPLTAFTLSSGDPAREHWVTALDPSKAGDVHRLSPFDPLVRSEVKEIYQDLSRAAEFQGLLISDDATLNDFEDASPEALETYRSWGMPADVGAIRANPALFDRWSAKKTSYLTSFSLDLIALVKADHHDLRTARNIFARVVLDPASERWFAQSMPEALATYDQVALMAMPYMEEPSAKPTLWLKGLVARVAVFPSGLRKTVFELQSVDWTKQGRAIGNDALFAQLQSVERAGGVNFGYYPDDFLKDAPAVKAIRPILSLKSIPVPD